MMFLIERISPDKLERQAWRFTLIVMGNSPDVRLAGYVRQVRQTPRHGFREETTIEEYNSSRAWHPGQAGKVLRRDEVSLPGDVKWELDRRLHEWLSGWRLVD